MSGSEIGFCNMTFGKKLLKYDVNWNFYTSAKKNVDHSKYKHSLLFQS